jgi:uncharacterized membrane protein YdbT with pleckstrin-like domain
VASDLHLPAQRGRSGAAPRLARQLGPGEELVLALHPHWRRLVVPFVAVPAVAALVTFLLLRGPAGGGFRVLVLGVAALVLVAVSLLPYLRWRTTHYVITTRRVMGRSGVTRRVGQDLPLYRIEDVAFEHSLLGRLLRSGDLVLQSSGEQGGLRLVDVPRVESVQRTVVEVMDDHDRRRREGSADHFDDPDDDVFDDSDDDLFED